MISPRCKDRPRWSREQIRAARRAPLPALLRREGVALRDRGNGNFEIQQYAGIIVKDGYWRCPDSGRAGNAIDLLVDVLGHSFHQAMDIICRHEAR